MHIRSSRGFRALALTLSTALASAITLVGLPAAHANVEHTVQQATFTLSDADKAGMSNKDYWWTNEGSHSWVKFVEAGTDLVLHYTVTSTDSGDEAPLANTSVDIVTGPGGASFTGSTTETTDENGEVTFTFHSTLANADAEPRPVAPSSMSYWDDSRGGFAEKKFNFEPTVHAVSENVDRVWTHTVKTADAPVAPEYTISLSAGDKAGMTNKDYWWTNAGSHSWVKFVDQGGAFSMHYTLTNKSGAVVAGQALSLSKNPINASFDCNSPQTTDANGEATFTCTNTNAAGEGEPYPSAPSTMSYWDDSRAISRAIEMDFNPTTGVADAIEHIDRVWAHVVKQNVAAPTEANIFLVDADKTMMTNKDYWWTNAGSHSWAKFVTAGGWLNLHYQVTDGNGDALCGVAVTLNTANNGRASFGGSTTEYTDQGGVVTFRLHNDTTDATAEPRPVAPSNMNYWDDSRGGTLNGESTFNFEPTVGADVEHVDRVWTHSVKAMAEATFTLADSDKSTMSNKDYWWTNEGSHSWVKFVLAGDSLALHYTVTDENGTPASDTEVVLNGGGPGSYAGSFPQFATTDANGQVTFNLTNTNVNADAEPHPVAPSSMSYWDDSRSVAHELTFNFEPTVIGAGTTHVDRVWTHIVKPAGGDVIPVANITLAAGDKEHMTNKDYWWTNAGSHSWVKFWEFGTDLVLHYRATDANGAGIANKVMTLNTAPGGASFTGSLTATTDANGYATFTLTNTTSYDDAEPFPMGASNMDYWDDSHGAELNGREVKYDFTPTIGASSENLDRVWTHTVRSAPTAPSDPADLLVTPGDGSLHVSFNSNDGHSAITSTTFRLGWKTTRSAKSIKLKTIRVNGYANDYTFENLANGIAYTVAVSVTNAVDTSATVSSDKVFAGAAQQPSIDQITAGNHKLVISFTQGDEGAAATSYFGVSLDGGATWKDSKSWRGSPITVKALENDTTYQVLVRQWNKFGPSAASEEMDGTPMADVPFAPRLGRIVSASNSLTVNFRAGKDGGAEIFDYEYSLDGGNTWSSAGSTDSPLEIDGLDSATQYSVAIRAVNSSGSGASSTVRAATTKKG